MSEKKLTVAELMARAAEEGQGESPKPRRRRRRSLDEGGVSVAELTGSIPAVESKPAESRHSSVPLDAADRESEEDPAADAVARHGVPTTDEVETTTAPTSTPPAAVADEDLVDGTETPEEGAGRSDGVDADESPATAETAPTDVPENPVESAPAEGTRPSSHETVVLSVVTDDDPVRLTTGDFPNITPRQIQQERAGAPEAAEEAPEAPAAVSAAVDAARTPAVAVDEAPPTTAMTTVTTEDTETSSAGHVDSSHDAPEGEADSAGQEKVSVAAVFGMILLGLVVGVALFFGFEKLWGHFNTAITAVLAIAVTGGIIGIVHALRTERDGLSMFLAGLAGLAVTFGPLLTA